MEFVHRLLIQRYRTKIFGNLNYFSPQVKKLGGSDPTVSDKREHSLSLFHLITGTDPSSETLFWEYHTGTNWPRHCVYCIYKVYLFINNFWFNHHIVPKIHINAVSLEGICKIVILYRQTQYTTCQTQSITSPHPVRNTHTYAYIVGHI